MVYRIVLSMNFDSDAVKLHEAVVMDNEDFISSRATEGGITASAESDSIMSLMRTADDFISCLQVAEKAMKKTCLP